MVGTGGRQVEGENELLATFDPSFPRTRESRVTWGRTLPFVIPAFAGMTVERSGSGV